ASASNRFMEWLWKTRWWCGTRKAHAAERSRRGSRARAVPAGTGSRRRAALPAQAEASRETAEEVQRQDRHVLPARLCVDAGRNSCGNRRRFFGTLLALFTADVANQAGPD